MKALIVGLVCVFFLRLATPARAVTVTVSPLSPTTLSDSEERTVSVTIAGGIDETTSSTLRAAFTEPGKTSYFGCTKLAGGSFYCGTDHTQFLSVTGTGPFLLTLRPDAGNSNYKGPGTYEFKVGRYTPGGSVTWSETQTVTIASSATPTPVSTPSPAPAQPTGVKLNEFVACPSSGQSEWVEILNTNASSVTLTDWKIKDSSGTSKPFTKTIAANSLEVIEIESSSAFLNNDGDTVKLVNGTDQEVETYAYSVCSSSSSWSKFDSGWEQTTQITKGATNARSPTPNPTTAATVAPTPTPTSKATVPPRTPAASSSARPLTTPESTGEILGLSALGEEFGPFAVERTPTATPSATTKKKTDPFAIIALGAGVLLLASLGGYMGYEWYTHKGKTLLEKIKVEG